MKRRVLAATLTLVGAAALSAYAFGGWAVISVDELPDHLQVGSPTQISFMVRQHGVEPMPGLHPTIEARTGGMIGGTTVEAKAVPGKKRGQYTAALTIPKSGEWKITVNSGFGPSRVTLLPMQALDANVKVAALSEPERGKRLFVAKGCVTCHVDAKSGVDGGMASSYGPNLTEKKFDGGYLAQWLANPAIRPPTKADARMPNPELTQKEIGSLVAFINGGTIAAAAKKQ
jgi:mono/diheme cytochrome c family protein